MLKIFTRTLIVLAAALLVSGVLYLVTPSTAAGPQRGPRPGGDRAAQQGPPQRRPEGGPQGNRGGFSLFAVGPVFTSFAAISVVTLLGVLVIRAVNGRKLAAVQETGTETA